MPRNAPAAPASSPRARPRPRAAAVEPAYVLHRYDWSESSLILDLFTRGRGRVAVAAKGAKRPYSQLRGVLLPFQRIAVGLGRAAAPEDDATAGEIATLRGAEWIGGATLPVGAALFGGFYLNELLLKMTARHDPHPALFDAYAATLEPLAAAREPGAFEPALRAFELRLLRETGLLPDLSVEVTTQAEVGPSQRYELTAEGVASAPDGDLSGAALLGLAAALEHGSQPALQAACERAPGMLKRALRAMILHHVGGQGLRSRRAMLDLQEFSG